MKCREVQLMLPDFVLNKLMNGQLSKIQSHLSHCKECQKASEDMQQVLLGLSEVKYEQPSEQYFTSILPRVHERIAAKEKTFRLPEFFMRFAMPIALILVTVTLFSNYDRMFNRPVLISAVSENTEAEESSSLDFSYVIGLTEVPSTDKISTIDKEVISDLISSEDITPALTEDDTKTIAGVFDQNDFNEFYALMEQKAVKN